MNDDSIRTRFPQYLKQSLLKKYSKIPSAPWIAKNFNKHLVNNEYPITSETARKWLNGSSFPSPKNLEILIDWLDIDHYSIYKSTTKKSLESNIVNDFNPDDNFLTRVIINHLSSLDRDDKLRLAFSIIALKSIKNQDYYNLLKTTLLDDKITPNSKQINPS